MQLDAFTGLCRKRWKITRRKQMKSQADRMGLWVSLYWLSSNFCHFKPRDGTKRIFICFVYFSVSAYVFCSLYSNQKCDWQQNCRFSKCSSFYWHPDDEPDHLFRSGFFYLINQLIIATKSDSRNWTKPINEPRNGKRERCRDPGGKYQIINYSIWMPHCVQQMIKSWKIKCRESEWYSRDQLFSCAGL